MALTDQIVQAVRDGSVILTANQRLSRTLLRIYDEHQCGRGLTGWATPSIVPFGTWLRARWSDALLAGAVAARPVLSPAQEELLWRAIIADTPQGATLLDLRGTAKSAMQAWRLVHQYRLPFDARFSAHEDWAAFESWAAAYRRTCDSNDWLDEARLPDAVREAIEARAVELPPSALLAGFDEFTPQQRDILDALERAGVKANVLEADEPEGAIVRSGCRDSSDELRSAARWAQSLLDADPRHSIGVVLLSLGARRSRLERIFDEVFHPEWMGNPAAAGTRAYHISVPDPLAGYPLVGAALLVLRLATEGRWAMEDAGRLLRLPFLGHGVDEAPGRALLDAKLRRRRRAYVTVRAMAGYAAGCPEWLGIIGRWQAIAAEIPESARASEWTRTIRRILEAGGWPGDRVLSSAEYQLFESWNGLLREFAALDRTAGALTYGEAIARLSDLAEDTQFQPQDPGAPVQILGALEAAGARFDAVWICGATDETWPAPSHPHPFLPLALARERRLPHSSPEREHEFAVRTFERLRRSAPELVVSWARRAGDVELRPSPLIEDLREAAPAAGFAAVRRESLELEQLLDDSGPALDTAEARGGTRLLKMQSACPFQAFADLRLGARSLDAAGLGLSAADRGSAIHEALRLFWEQVRDQARLLAMSVEDLGRTAESAAEGALRKVLRDAQPGFEARFRDLEARRLARVLIEWAGVEKLRTPFSVAFSECARTISIGGLEIAARIDRVDQLPDGRQVIIDYKTNAPSASAWSGDRPDEPQLPLYAISNEAPVAAVAFAQVGGGDMRFKGFADAGVLPGVKPFETTAEEQLEAWRGVLEPIAESFRNGMAAVDPQKGACEFCGLTPLCRVHEVAPDVLEEPDADA